MSDKNKKVLPILSVILSISIVLNIYMLQEKTTQRKNNDYFLNSAVPKTNKEVGYVLEDTYEYFINNGDINLTSIDRRLYFVKLLLRNMKGLNSEFDFNINAFSSYFLYLLPLERDSITDYDREALRQLSNLGSVLKLPNSYANQKDVWVTKENNKLIPTEKTRKYYAEIERISKDILDRHESSAEE